MKKVIAVIVSILMLAFSALPVFAADVTNDTHKDSLVNYASKGGLSYTTQQLLSFDDTSIVYEGTLSTDTVNKKEGSASLTKSFGKDSSSWETVFETKRNTINFGINNRMKETVKMWVYVNDIDLLYCDHDGVYDTPQKGSGTLIIDFAKDGGTQRKYSIQHTIEGSGWHLIEISFNTNNNLYSQWSKMDLTSLKYMKVSAHAYKGLVLNFDDLTKYTYNNDGYTEPECPNGGRWLSTCDYNSLDGSVLTEWYASSFDLKDKTQGSSSVSLTGRKEHVDYRCVWGGLDEPVDRNKDILHFDMYISDLKLVGTDFQARIAQSESGEGRACYSWGYDLTNRNANNGDGLVNGWNSIDIPLANTTSNVDTKYYASKGGLDFKADKLTFFWTGTSSDKWYTVKYDNIYVYTKTSQNSIKNPPQSSSGGKLGYSDEKIAEIAKGIADKSITKIASSTSQEDMQRILDYLKANYPDVKVEFDQEGNVVEASLDIMVIVAVAGGAVLLAVITAVVIIIILRKKKGQKPSEQILEQLDEENKQSE